MKTGFIIAGTENGKMGERTVYLRDVLTAKHNWKEAWTDDIDRVIREVAYYETKQQAQAIIDENQWTGLYVCDGFLS